MKKLRKKDPNGDQEFLRTYSGHEIQENDTSLTRNQLEANFKIELIYGETKPRLVYRNNQKLVATMDNTQNQYHDREFCMWTIQIQKKDPK